MSVLLVIRGCPHYNSSGAVVLVCDQKFARKLATLKILLSKNSMKQNRHQECERCGSRNLTSSLVDAS